MSPAIVPSSREESQSCMTMERETLKHEGRNQIEIRGGSTAQQENYRTGRATLLAVGLWLLFMQCLPKRELIQKMTLSTLGFSRMEIQRWTSLEWEFNVGLCWNRIMIWPGLLM
jgi:hypothetical protein